MKRQNYIGRQFKMTKFVICYNWDSMVRLKRIGRDSLMQNLFHLLQKFAWLMSMRLLQRLSLHDEQKMVRFDTFRSKYILLSIGSAFHPIPSPITHEWELRTVGELEFTTATLTKKIIDSDRVPFHLLQTFLPSFIPHKH